MLLLKNISTDENQDSTWKVGRPTHWIEQLQAGSQYEYVFQHFAFAFMNQPINTKQFHGGILFLHSDLVDQ